MLKANYHIHSEFCPHGNIDNTEDVVKLAIAEGFKIIGFSEHAPLPDDFIDPSPMKDSYINIGQLDLYITQITKLKEKYKDQIEIKMGLEVDYVPKHYNAIRDLINRYNIEYTIGSVHFIENICVDFSKEEQDKLINTLGSWDMVKAKYFELLGEMIENYRCEIIGHLDLIKKFGQAVILDEHMEIVLMKIKKNKQILEINSSGFHKDAKEQYPTIEIIKRANELVIPLIFGSDSHNLNSMNQDYEKILKLLESHNIELSNL